MGKFREDSYVGAALRLKDPEKYRELLREYDHPSFERWLYDEYLATLEIWRTLSHPLTRAQMFSTMQTLERVARHLITGQDDPVAVLSKYADRLIIFTQHRDHLIPREDDAPTR